MKKCDMYDVWSDEFRNAILDEFDDVFDDDGPLEPMNGPPMVINLKPGLVFIVLSKSQSKSLTF